MKKSLQYNLLLLLVCTAIFWLDEQIINTTWLHPQKWWILLFLYILSLLSSLLHQAAYRSAHPQAFQKIFFLSMLLRLLLSPIFLVWSIKTGISQPLLFVFQFFVLYFLFIGFEIYALLHNLRAGS